jgi:acyl-CoA synthetase (NDP forming)
MILLTDIKQLFQQLFEDHRNTLTEFESKLVLSEIGIPIPPQTLVPIETDDDALASAEEIGYPVVAKLMASDLSHKSDAGAVKLNLHDADELVVALNELRAIETTGEVKVNIQAMAKKPIAEVIVGMVTDGQFGPALMFGLGGVFVELMKDVSFRIAPLSEFDANEMIHEIKGFPLLDGFRGAPKADVGAITDLLLNLSSFVLQYPEVDQIDINPVFVYETSILAVDARIVLKSHA